MNRVYIGGMNSHDWMALASVFVGGILGMISGVLLSEVVRLLANKNRRRKQIERIRVFGFRSVIRKALMGDRQPELELTSRHA